MIRKFLLAALLATSVLHGAIKKSGEAKPPAKADPKTREQTPPSSDKLLEELRKRAHRGRGGLRFDEHELLEFFRGVLEAQGVPAEELQKADLRELLQLLREKNPEAFDGFGSGVLPGFGRETEKKLNEHFEQLLEGHRPGAAAAASATFSLRDGKKPADPLGFATGVRSGGWLLTKASEVSGAGELQCEIRGAWVAAKVVRTWPEHDLALLQAAAPELAAVKWSELGEPAVGTFITAVAPAGRDPVAIGIVSVTARNEQTKGRGFLGVSLTSDERGVKIETLVAGGPAKASGLQAEDRILEIDGKKPDSVFMFTKMVSDRKAGEKVRLKLQRGEAIVEKEIALGDRSLIPGMGRGGPDKMNSMGSTLSKRRTDFSSVLQTDLPLQATQCGGPVTDLDGNVVGLIIARSGRVETLVIPSATIRALLASVDFSREEKPAAPAAK